MNERPIVDSRRGTAAIAFAGPEPTAYPSAAAHAEVTARPDATTYPGAEPSVGPATASIPGVLCGVIAAALLLVAAPLAAQSQAPRAQPVLPSPTPAQSAAAQAGTAPAGGVPKADPLRGGNPPPPFGGHPGDQPLVSPPLPVVPGTVPWDLLGQVRTVRVKDRFVPEFSPAIGRLDRQDVRIVGFMLPLQPGDRQSHFLLTVTSQTCAFCVPAGPEGIVEIRTKTPVKVTFDPVLIAGRLEILRNDPLGVYYRIGNGEALPIR